MMCLCSGKAKQKNEVEIAFCDFYLVTFIKPLGFADFLMTQHCYL